MSFLTHLAMFVSGFGLGALSAIAILLFGPEDGAR